MNQHSGFMKVGVDADSILCIIAVLSSLMPVNSKQVDFRSSSWGRCPDLQWESQTLQLYTLAFCVQRKWVNSDVWKMHDQSSQWISPLGIRILYSKHEYSMPPWRSPSAQLQSANPWINLQSILIFLYNKHFQNSGDHENNINTINCIMILITHIITLHRAKTQSILRVYIHSYTRKLQATY